MLSSDPSGLPHFSHHAGDPGALSTRHQWTDALVGVGPGQGISCQRVLGCGVRVDLHQPRELGFILVFAPIVVHAPSRVWCSFVRYQEAGSMKYSSVSLRER